MSRWNYFYLIRIEFLGFRYHGWQIQPGLKTVQGMVEKTLGFVLPRISKSTPSKTEVMYKTLGCSRTDSKVSANDFAFELFLKEDIIEENFIDEFNKNLPPDIRAKSIHSVLTDFNIIQSSKIKEYRYYFSFGKKTSPFSAPFIFNVPGQLDIEKMKWGAVEFKGFKNFERFTSQPSENTVFKRNILESKIEESDQLPFSLLNENKIFCFRVRSRGFLRYQVRLMVGALLELGSGEISKEDFLKLFVETGPPIKRIATPSGLCLHKVDFEI